MQKIGTEKNLRESPTSYNVKNIYYIYWFKMLPKKTLKKPRFDFTFFIFGIIYLEKLFFFSIVTLSLLAVPIFELRN